VEQNCVGTFHQRIQEGFKSVMVTPTFLFYFILFLLKNLQPPYILMHNCMFVSCVIKFFGNECSIDMSLYLSVSIQFL
jgi:hypothetical protein